MNNKGLVMYVLVISILLGIGSTNFFFFWVCLELNTLIFCYWLSIEPIYNSSLVTMKYFLVQALSSSVFISSNIWFFFEPPFFIHYYSLLGSLLLKLGMFPFHHWVLSLCNSMNWPNFTLLITIQKILPLYALSTVSLSNFFFYLCLLSMILSSWFCFNVTSIQKILTYSSIFSMSWILVIVPKNLSISFLFFLIYTTLVSLMVVIPLKTHTFFTQQFLKKSLNLNSILFFFLATSSMGGLPPSMGFLMKLMMMKEMISQSIPLTFLSFALVLSLFMLSFYLTMSFIFTPWFKSSFFLKSPMKPWILLTFSNLAINSLSFIILLNFLTL